MSSRAYLLAAVVTATLAVFGCGGDGGDDDSMVGAGGVFGSGGVVGTGGLVGSGGDGLPGTGGIEGTGGALGTGGVPGTGGVLGAGGITGTGGTIEPGCCADCFCRGPEPTEESLYANGPYPTESYTSGFADKPNFLAATIYYPGGDAAPPFAGVVICPGWTAYQSSIAGWGPFLASHGIVVMTIDTNNNLDPVATRALALMDALASLKEENTRPGSPLYQKLDDDRYGLMGWSMGGGATWMNTKDHPELKTGISLAGHQATAGGPSIAAGITVPSLLFAGNLDQPILGGGQSQPVYDVIPATTPKILYEMSGVDHFQFGTPLTTHGGELGRYGLAFQKVFLEGDERYRKFLLVDGPNASDWRSTL